VNVLVLWPPHVPSYFNAGHHLPSFTVGAYLRTLPEVREVRVIDAGALNCTWKELADVIFQGQFDVIAVQNEFDTMDGLERLFAYVSRLAPGSKLVSFGRLSNLIPEHFQRYPLHGIVHTGDYEAGVAAFVRSLMSAPEPIPGVWIAQDGVWLPPSAPGAFLDPAEWILPDFREIPYEAYDRMYSRDENKFCGIPQRRELVVPVARGCPIGCSFCEVPGLQGRRERRLSVERTLGYIESAFAESRFEYVAFYAPTFTLNRRWVSELCDEVIRRGSVWPWKCATTLAHLDADLVMRMGRAGCVRVSVGLETLDRGGYDALPPAKRTDYERFDQIAEWCSLAGVELNCFVVLGLPGTSPQGAQATADHVRARGARLRPTIYAPIDRLRPTMAAAEVDAFNRHFLADAWSQDEAQRLYRLMFGHEPRPTRVMDRIPIAVTRPPSI
jgi:anaerobic magnesium-protoporphyrin IX monomethyl ester cyclase